MSSYIFTDNFAQYLGLEICFINEQTHTLTHILIYLSHCVTITRNRGGGGTEKKNTTRTHLWLDHHTHQVNIHTYDVCMCLFIC